MHALVIIINYDITIIMSHNHEAVRFGEHGSTSHPLPEICTKECDEKVLRARAPGCCFRAVVCSKFKDLMCGLEPASYCVSSPATREVERFRVGAWLDVAVEDGLCVHLERLCALHFVTSRMTCAYWFLVGKKGIHYMWMISP